MEIINIALHIVGFIVLGCIFVVCFGMLWGDRLIMWIDKKIREQDKK